MAATYHTGLFDHHNNNSYNSNSSTTITNDSTMPQSVAIQERFKRFEDLNSLMLNEKTTMIIFGDLRSLHGQDELLASVGSEAYQPDCSTQGHLVTTTTTITSVQHSKAFQTVRFFKALSPRWLLNLAFIWISLVFVNHHWSKEWSTEFSPRQYYK